MGVRSTTDGSVLRQGRVTGEVPRPGRTSLGQDGPEAAQGSPVGRRGRVAGAERDWARGPGRSLVGRGGAGPTVAAGQPIRVPSARTEGRQAPTTQDPPRRRRTWRSAARRPRFPAAVPGRTWGAACGQPGSGRSDGTSAIRTLPAEP